ncbi:MAG TPA: hypothetical protein VFZ97_01565 [Acidimicrobiales bacterium]
MSDADDQLTDSPAVLDRRRLFEEVRVRLSAVTDSLSDFKMEAGQLRTTSQELLAVVHRIEWLADLSTPGPFTRSASSASLTTLDL